MLVFKCKMCGGNLEVTEDQVLATCEYCGTQQTLPKIDDEKKLALFNRANNLRLKSEFDKAAGIYESIIAEFPEEAEAYWGLVLCKYGIEYVDDKDGSKLPTCHRTLPTSIMKDEDFQQACENADISAKNVYRDEAKAIDSIQKKILEIAATEEPYDIFICYKETDDVTGARTEDSSIAQDIYTALTEMGYKVFYARNSLRKVAGAEYEPYIYAALSSAKIMLAIGTKYEYYDAVWVKNEWSRFISMIASNPSKVLIPCYKNMDAYDIPEEFSNMQALDMADMMFFNSLEASVKRVLPIQSKSSSNDTSTEKGATATVDSLLKRAFMFLEDGDWKSAQEYCEKVLDIDPENGQAHLGNLLIEYKVRKVEDLERCKNSFENSMNYQKIVRYSDDGIKNALQGYITSINIRNEEEKAECEREKEAVRLAKKKIRMAIFSAIAVVVAVTTLLTTVVIPRIKFSDIASVSAGHSQTVGLKSDGTVVAIGRKNDISQCDVEDWTDIVAISAGINYTVGLKSDGTVVAVGAKNNGKCNVSGWKNIVAISASEYHTVGLKSDGTVVATKLTDNPSYENSGQCDVNGWTNIVAITAGEYHTVGLKKDRTVIATKYCGDPAFNYGQCDVKDWTDIVAIAAGNSFTVGLKSDGTVVAVGLEEDCSAVSNWTDIVAISAGEYYIVGLKSDGTVVATGYSSEVSKWMDIVEIDAGSDHIVGLKSDGTVVAVGNNAFGRTSVGRKK